MRKKQGLTQEDMAEKIGRSVDMVSGLERGTTFAGFDTLTRIANLMGCTLDELFTFDPEAKPRKRNEIDEIIALLEDKPPALRKAALAQLKVLLDFDDKTNPKPKG